MSPKTPDELGGAISPSNGALTPTPGNFGGTNTPNPTNFSVPNANAADNPNIDIVFVKELPKSLQCLICNQVLRSPIKLPCDHKFCTNCITGMSKCQSCDKEFDMSKIKMDKETHRQIQKLEVKCSFHDNGCPWQGVLKDLASHSLNCEFADVVCPRGCGEVYPKKDESKHLEEECGKKMAKCEFCQKEVPSKGMQIHLKICPSVIIECPNKCGLENKTRAEITDHLPVCPKAGSACPFAEFGCVYTGGRENIQKHIKEQPVKHLSFLCDGVLDLKTLLGAVQLNMEKMVRNMDIIHKRIDSLEKLYGAQFIWRIDNVKQKQNEAKSGARSTIFSPPFLSGRHGYKLILSASLYGDGPVRGQHLSVFISIMRGEFDALLPWPFVHKITFTLMDQNPNFEERQHIAYVVKPHSSLENKPFLDRPISERNASFGAQKLCELEVAENYIRDDVMFIKCNIDTENMIVL